MHPARLLRLTPLLVCLGGIFSAAADTAHAHGVAHQPLATQATAMRFVYSDGQPAAFAGIEVFAPGSETPYQSARADAQGGFAFIPASAGTWRVVMNDGMGHRTEVDLPLQHPTDSAPPHTTTPAKASPQANLILGLSLLANLFLAITLLRKRNPQA